jgi:hypothetical protein
MVALRTTLREPPSIRSVSDCPSVGSCGLGFHSVMFSISRSLLPSTPIIARHFVPAEAVCPGGICSAPLFGYEMIDAFRSSPRKVTECLVCIATISR